MMLKELTLPRYQFTTDEYYKMLDAGILTGNDRVELIRGEIVEMSPVGLRHAACVKRLIGLFRYVDKDVMIDVQNPIHLPDHSEPEPDVILLRHRDDFYIGGHPEPEDILLLIEVADSSLPFDKNVKIPLYANAGILETWIISLDNDEILIYRDPTITGYRQTLRAWKGDTISPQFVPDTKLTVSQILGK